MQVIKKTPQKKKAAGKKTEYKFARVTKYLKTGRPMSNGHMPKVGYCAVSDRSIKKGSLIWVDRTRYIVGDYTNLRIHDKFKDQGYDLTVDIFTTASKQEAKQFGSEDHRIALLRKS